jgi:hypothetical protein
MGRSGDGLRGPRFRLPWPAGIRNGGLLALVDEPPEAGPGRSLPGVFQHLPPPTGITQLPPTVAEPPAGGDGAATPGPAGEERSLSAGRAHPRRQHPRPGRAVAAGSFKGDVVSRPVGGQTGGGQPGGGGTPPSAVTPPTTAPPVQPAPVARVRVPPVEARGHAPGRPRAGPARVRVATPEVAVELPAG